MEQFSLPREIAGADLGLIGVGSIGSKVAKHADAMGHEGGCGPRKSE